MAVARESIEPLGERVEVPLLSDEKRVRLTAARGTGCRWPLPSDRGEQGATQ